jgi:glycosyltransferase involved in cell wall biosynthesis
MSKLSILMVVAKYPPDFGHNTVINNLCKNLNKLGCKTAIGAFSFDSDPPFNIEKVKLNKTKLLTSGTDYLDFDIIHSHQPRVNYYLLFKKPNKPIIMHVHGASNIIHNLNYKFSMLLFKNNITKTIAVSNSAAIKLKQLIGNISLQVIYNGVDTDFYHPELTSNFKKGSPQLLFVGGLRKYKNVKILISMMSKLLVKLPDAHLQIIGDGDEYENLKNLVKNRKLENNVELVGKIIDNEQLRLYYGSCDAYISASSLEACPVPPFEAMSCEKPLILYGIDPHKEIIDSSHSGLIFESLNEDEMCEKIQEVLKNKINFGKKGRTFVMNYSWLNVSKLFLNLYENLTKN